ncbi:MAG: glutamate-cysteine ligase family protein [Pseudomonadota bacterium]|nr:glutamate-cysteine ligase family protein [Pseudomonadota bacterium]
MMTHGLTPRGREEFFVLDPSTAAVVTDGQPVLKRLEQQGLLGDKGSSYMEEFQRSLIESRTAMCKTLGQVRATLQRLRSTLVQAGRDEARWIVAAGTLPLADWRTQRITSNSRYERMLQMQQQVAREQMICGFHLHAGINDRELHKPSAAVVARSVPRDATPCLTGLSAERTAPHYRYEASRGAMSCSET